MAVPFQSVPIFCFCVWTSLQAPVGYGVQDHCLFHMLGPSPKEFVFTKNNVNTSLLCVHMSVGENNM